MDAPPRAAVRPPARRGSRRSSAMETGEMEQARATEGDTQHLSAASGMSMTLVYFALS